MISIYTHSFDPRKVEFWKWVARKLVRKFSGPDAVVMSVLRGLRAEGVPFRYNPLFRHSDIALVLASPDALRRAIARKKLGTVTKLIAGPNIVVGPASDNAIMQDEAIDKILLPSQWTVDYWTHDAPLLSKKISIWPAGVSIHEPSNRKGAPIIYDKRPTTKDAKHISEFLLSKDIHAETLRYGTFKQEEYFALLCNTPYVIYISEVESQGLALQEAWSRNVPTFVQYSGKFVAGNRTWSDPKINAPLLTDELGSFFKTESELYDLAVKSDTFQPKKYCDKHLSDAASIQQLLRVIKS